MSLGAPTPILRMFDENKAREFYIDYLGFAIEFEHRFSKDSPLYIGIIRDGCTLHLSEHHGDGTPGTFVRIPATGLEDLAKALQSKNYKYGKPGMPQEMPWGTTELNVVDPFNNKLFFFES